MTKIRKCRMFPISVVFDDYGGISVWRNRRIMKNGWSTKRLFFIRKPRWEL